MNLLARPPSAQPSHDPPGVTLPQDTHALLCTILKELERLNAQQAALMDLLKVLSFSSRKGSSTPPESVPEPTQEDLSLHLHRPKDSLVRFLADPQNSATVEFLQTGSLHSFALYKRYVAWCSLRFGPDHCPLTSNSFGRHLTASKLFSRKRDTRGIRVALLPDWLQRIRIFLEDLQEFDLAYDRCHAASSTDKPQKPTTSRSTRP